MHDNRNDPHEVRSALAQQARYTRTLELVVTSSLRPKLSGL
jgi:hypothetical protein